MFSPTAVFWLDSIHLFDPQHGGPQWEQPMSELVEHTVRHSRDLADLVRDAIVIQRFLLELLTRHDVHRSNDIDQLSSLLAPAA